MRATGIRPRVLRETTLADIEPPPGYLSYDPPGRYALGATWGYPIHAHHSHPGGDARPGCSFVVVDTITGAELRRTRASRSPNAEVIAGELREYVDRLNERDEL